jgi:hypothetical protein
VLGLVKLIDDKGSFLVNLVFGKTYLNRIGVFIYSFNC